ncbi:class I SAM-dependent methyltransferase [Herbivorax sp. ANBcel31]|uniref:class I SAM-dependent methyltransferase n=1 Tax=Herbivorax sp. ANBcel31 TaxID=3069754 RepID=UPI0027B00172|nr:class I SAM-dependent methyltransferase [Herbivorax sp. ANBcel31]MDQ2084966.1 class I SAM-dependent methyltransferase [Herbivorax sp. ANBcel31]
MGFYDEISKYYDYIFPANKAQMLFLQNLLTKDQKTVLDVACGSGNYSIELAKAGYDVTAIDSTKEMIEKLRQKAQKEKLNIKSYICDMREIINISPLKYHLIFCIGNSIVHLNSIEEITDVLRQMKSLLNKNGSLVLQIINYDRIINFGVTELPKIENKDIGLEFERKYEFSKDKNIINFNTKLKVKEGVYRNSIELLPIKSLEFENILLNAGFKTYKFYGDFNYSPYNEKSYILLLEVRN